MEAERTLFTPDRAFLRSAPDVIAARPALGLTLYLAEPEVWARQGAADVLDAFLGHVAPERLRWFTTSMIPDWRPLGRAEMDELRQLVSTAWYRGRPRHLFSFRISDTTDAPSLALSYREVNPAREKRAAVIQITLPLEEDPDILLALAMQIGQRLPFWSGVGGYVASWNELEIITGFHVAHPWCRRYLGMDMQYPDATAWRASEGLPGTNWLTLIGAPLAKAREIDLAALQNVGGSTDVQALPLAQGLLLKAGDEPTLGDVNLLAYPVTYAEVACALAPHFIESPPDFPGERWRGELGTSLWFRRFIEPKGWS